VEPDFVVVDIHYCCFLIVEALIHQSNRRYHTHFDAFDFVGTECMVDPTTERVQVKQIYSKLLRRCQLLFFSCSQCVAV